MMPISHWFLQRRRRIGRALLLGLAVIWSTAAVSPCVVAAPTCLSPPAGMADCPYAGGDDDAMGMPDCAPLMQLDCQSDQQSLLAAPLVTADLLPPLTMALLNTLPVVTLNGNAGADSALRHAASAAATPRPPLNLLHARLLI